MIDLLIPKFDLEHPRSAVMNMALLANMSHADTYAFLHDDVTIHDIGGVEWQFDVESFIYAQHKFGMVGFGGALGLGTDDIYKRPYNLMQLARLDFISNMDEAELHGRRVTVPTQVSVLDGFCQIIQALLHMRMWEGGRAYLILELNIICMMLPWPA